MFEVVVAEQNTFWVCTSTLFVKLLLVYLQINGILINQRQMTNTSNIYAVVNSQNSSATLNQSTELPIARRRFRTLYQC
jgi:hypothetical protein